MNRLIVLAVVTTLAAVMLVAALIPVRVRPNFMADGSIALTAADAPGRRMAGTAYRRTRWSDLASAHWDSRQVFHGQDIASLQDADPRAQALLGRMQSAWDQAPANPALNGVAIRTAGYVVPIQDTREGLREFLLVPYFGSCIHVPPPPANQIIDVSSPSPIKDLHSMDAVWVSGVLSIAHANHDAGASSYAMRADEVESYTGPTQ